MLKSFVDKWVTPAGMLVILGFVIWLAQLNWHALEATAKNAEQDIIQKEILAQQVEVSTNVQQTAILLSQVVEEVKNLRASHTAHQIEAEKWKERIRNLQNEIDNN